MSRLPRPTRWIVAVAAGLLAGGIPLTLALSAHGPSPGPPSGPAPAASQAIPAALLREARPIGRGPRFAPPGPARVVGRCARARGDRFGIHLELFAADRVIIVPAGIGSQRPWQLNEGRIATARCYGRFVTTDPTGVVAVSPGGHPTLGDLFAAWGQPLGPARLLSFRGQVRTYVDGRRVAIDPVRLPLWGHDEIVLEVGPYVPPHVSYMFPPAAGA